MRKNLKIVLVAVLAIVAFAQLVTEPTFAQPSGAQNAISSAQETIKNCYLAVKQAQDAGANVDSLMVTLNEATSLLTKAQLAFGSNDNSAAYTYASQSQSKLGDFISQANAAKEGALAVGTQNSILSIVSLVVAIAIACGGAAFVLVLNRSERKQPQ